MNNAVILQLLFDLSIGEVNLNEIVYRLKEIQNQVFLKILKTILVAYELENPALWKALYEKASAFRDLACWKKINDSQLFGVQNPHTAEI